MNLRAAYLLAAFLLAALLSGCTTFPGSDPGEIDHVPDNKLLLPAPPLQYPEPGDVRLGTVYYPDRQLRFLVPVHREIPYTEGIARVTLEHLVATPALDSAIDSLGFTPSLPAGTSVLGITIDEGLARVDFSGALLNYPPEEERLVLGSIICTLVQFSTINRVEIMVEGSVRDYFPGGTPGSMPFGPECWINLEIDSNLQDYRQYSVSRLYFCYAAPDGRIFYVPVTRILEPREDENLAVLEELLEGPRRGSGLFSEIPPGTVLLGWGLEDGLLTLDLSGELLSYRGGRTGAENVVNQLLLTLSGLPGVEAIQVLVEGEKTPMRDYPDLVSPLSPLRVYNYIKVPD